MTRVSPTPCALPSAGARPLRFTALAAALFLGICLPLPILAARQDDDRRGETPESPVAAQDAAGVSASVSRDLVVIEVGEQGRLREINLAVIWKGASFILADWSKDDKARARDAGISFTVIRKGIADNDSIFLFELHEDEVTPAEWAGRVLYQKGRDLVLILNDKEAEAWMETGYRAVTIPRVRRGWEAPAPLVPFTCTPNATISTLLSRTNQVQWLDWIEKISGVEPVSIAGTNYTIQTRHSATMFSGQPQAKGYDYALQQAQSWHYGLVGIEEDPYVYLGSNQKNLVLTIPGQTSPSEIVLVTGHYDSTSPMSSTLAPGANDNGTGSATLFEAARLLRQFRFNRTIKIIFFTGEEQGLRGSAAYIADHPQTGVLGVVNLDMFGWDSNNDRCFEIHVGTLSQSMDIGNCFRDSIASYGLGLTQDFLTTGATSQSDHASFWNANVGAIEISENYFNNNLPGGCVGSDPNTRLHTVNDTLAQNVHPNYAFDIAKTALATISAMAIPSGTCFTSAPALSATPGVNSVDLSWSAVSGASSYRVFRSSQSCQGQWFEIAEIPGTAFTDTNVQALTYSYHVEAVHPDGFCVSAPSACASATPTVYHASVTGYSYVDSCLAGGPGSGNGIVEPGETVVMPVTLLNDGNTALTGITGALSEVSAGFTIDDASASWPNLAQGASSSSQANHFRFLVDASQPCGSPLAASLLVSHDQGSNTQPISVPIGTTASSDLLNVNFSAGIPAGWTIVDGGSGGGAAATWTTANPGNRSIGAPFSAPFAIIDSDRAGTTPTQDEQLITPALNASSCAQTILEFSNQFRRNAAEIADVDVSTNGGSSWTNALRMQGASDGYTTPNTKVLDISAAIAGNPSNVKVRFHYYNAQFEWWWAIDNVRVRCTQPVCAVCPAPPGSPGEAGVSPLLTVQKNGGDLDFSWGAPGGSCALSSYALYRGSLATLRSTGYSHGTALTCAAGTTTFGLPINDPQLGTADYFIVVASSGSEEGSYGRSSAAAERPVSTSACEAAQNLASCGP